MNRYLFILIFLLFPQPASSWAAESDTAREYAGITVSTYSPPSDSVSLTIIQLDPTQEEVAVLCAAQEKHDALQIHRWAETHKLLIAVTAGMFLQDYHTPVGYFRTATCTEFTDRITAHKSLLALHPRDSTSPAAWIFDLDTVTIAEIENGYTTLVQNLRLIKGAGRNQWDPDTTKWAEVALAQCADSSLIIAYSETPLSMYRFNEILLAHPSNIRTAQHLDGGKHAALYLSPKLNAPGFITNIPLMPVPNIIGVRE
ncbi:MAG: phosphodiester glycosidase family protein [Fibrobacterota bacterium]